MDSQGATEEGFRQAIGHRTMLEAYVRLLIHDPTLAEDVLADALVQIAKAWPTYNPSRPYAPWARGVARHVAFARLRRESRQPISLAEDVLESVAAEIDRLGTETALHARFEALRRCLIDCLDGALGTADAVALNETLRTDPAAWRALAELAVLDIHLTALARQPRVALAESIIPRQTGALPPVRTPNARGLSRPALAGSRNRTDTRTAQSTHRDPAPVGRPLRQRPNPRHTR